MQPNRAVLEARWFTKDELDRAHTKQLRKVQGLLGEQGHRHEHTWRRWASTSSAASRTLLRAAKSKFQCQTSAVSVPFHCPTWIRLRASSRRSRTTAGRCLPTGTKPVSRQAHQFLSCDTAAALEMTAVIHVRQQSARPRRRAGPAAQEGHEVREQPARTHLQDHDLQRVLHAEIRPVLHRLPQEPCEPHSPTCIRLVASQLAVIRPTHCPLASRQWPRGGCRLCSVACCC